MYFFVPCLLRDSENEEHSSKIFHLFGFPSWESSDPIIIGIKTYLFENFSQKKGSWMFIENKCQQGGPSNAIEKRNNL